MGSRVEVLAGGRDVVGGLNEHVLTSPSGASSFSSLDLPRVEIGGTRSTCERKYEKIFYEGQQKRYHLSNLEVFK